MSKDARTYKDETPMVAPEESGPGDKLGVDIAILWRGDMLTARFFSKPMTVTIGPEGTFTMPEDVIGKALAVLVEPGTSAGFGLRIDHEKAHGHLIVDGDVHDLEDVRSGKIPGVTAPLVALAKGTRAVLVFGDFTFIVSRVPVPPPATFSLWNKEMLPFLLCFIASLAMTVGPLVAAFNSSGFRNRTQMSLKEKQEARLAHLLEIDVIEEKPEEKPEEKVEKEEEKPKLEPEEIKKAKEDKEEKAVVKEVEKLQEQLKDLNEDERKDKVKELVAAEVQKVDSQIDAALADADKQMMGTKLFAEDDGSPGDTANPAAGAGGSTVLADPEGKSQGAGLMGDSGPKTSVGSADTTKRQGVAGLEKDNKAGKDVKLGLTEKKQTVVRVGGSAAAAIGELPKKVIQDYIRRKMGAIKACYQKGLQSNPDLQGTVKVKFLIQPGGQVGGAKIEDSSLGNASVEDCVMTNIKSWRFPQAKGGGSTTVVYPFRFSSR